MREKADKNCVDLFATSIDRNRKLFDFNTLLWLSLHCYGLWAIIYFYCTIIITNGKMINCEINLFVFFSLNKNNSALHLFFLDKAKEKKANFWRVNSDTHKHTNTYTKFDTTNKMSDRDSVSHISEGGANRPLKYELCAFFAVCLSLHTTQRIQSISVVLCICRLVNVLCVNSYILMRPRATEHILFTKHPTTKRYRGREAFRMLWNRAVVAHSVWNEPMDGMNEQYTHRE